MIFDAPSFDRHEHVVFGHDPHTGLKAIIAIHRLGPEGRALGGCRMVAYATEEEALDDVLRLSKGMTYKAAVAHLPLGGAKSVIIGNPQKQKTPALLHSMGRFIDSLRGQYITSVDVGISGHDVAIMQADTRFAVGAGDPSPTTAFGVFRGIQAAVKYRMNTDDLSGIRVAVSGVGKVGFALCEFLYDHGVALTIADVNRDAVTHAVDRFQAKAVDVHRIASEEVDIFAPCALGGIIDTAAIDKMKASIIAGGANNQLAHDDVVADLKSKGILYAPDYVVNAGGLINVASEVVTYSAEEVHNRTDHIYDTLLEIFGKADAEDKTTLAAAEDIARQRYHARVAAVAA